MRMGWVRTTFQDAGQKQVGIGGWGGEGGGEVN